MKKNIALALVIIMVCSLSACVSNPNDSSTDYIPPTSDLEESTENQTATIGHILLSGKADTEPFCNGYAIVEDDDDDSIYIINTKGEICVSMHNDTNFRQIISASRTMNMYNFYDEKAVFISEYGTISIPINNYNGNGYHYWPSSDEIEVLGVTEENLVLVRETKESPDGSVTTFGVQDYLGNWVVEPSIINFENENYFAPDQYSNDCEANYIGNEQFLIHEDLIGYCLFNSDDGSYEYYGQVGYGESLPIKKKYWSEDFKYKVEDYGFLRDGVQMVTIKNDNGVHFAVAIDENGTQLYEAIQLNGNSCAEDYSEGLVALEIVEFNVEYIIYIDKKGNECVRFLANKDDKFIWYGDDLECHNGIITDGYHYYDKNGNILFEQ